MIPFSFFTRIFNKIPFLPFYHAIGYQEELPHIKNLYTPRNKEQFISDLDFFLQYFEPIDLFELIKRIEENNFMKNGKPIFHLSFDDGLRQVYDVAKNILIQKGIPATIFINPNFLDNKELFFRYEESLRKENINPENFLKEYKPYLTTQQIESLINQGFTFGGHSMDHPHYYEISEDEQLNQTLNSISYTKKKIQLRLQHFFFSIHGLWCQKFIL